MSLSLSALAPPLAQDVQVDRRVLDQGQQAAVDLLDDHPLLWFPLPAALHQQVHLLGAGARPLQFASLCDAFNGLWEGADIVIESRCGEVFSLVCFSSPFSRTLLPEKVFHLLENSIFLTLSLQPPAQLMLCWIFNSFRMRKQVLRFLVIKFIYKVNFIKFYVRPLRCFYGVFFFFNQKQHCC